MTKVSQLGFVKADFGRSPRNGSRHGGSQLGTEFGMGGYAQIYLNDRLPNLIAHFFKICLNVPLA